MDALLDGRDVKQNTRKIRLAQVDLLARTVFGRNEKKS